MFNPNKPTDESLLEQRELAPEIAIVPPPAESLINPEAENSFWPDEIKNNQELKAQAETRRILSSRLDSLFSRIPQTTMELAEAIDSNLVSPKDATETYELLTNFLESDENNKRFVLYLPFELLCQKNWQPQSEKLAGAIKKFHAAYLKQWRESLKDSDVRANFVDGDILESEIRNELVPRVKKAAHFIPKLVEKELISPSDIISIMETSQDNVLLASVSDALPVLADMSLLPRNEWKRLLLSPNPVLQASAFSTVHGLEKEKLLDQEERNKLFEMLDPKFYARASTEQMYENMEKVLAASAEMMAKNVVSEKDAEHLCEALAAATQFWSMNYSSSNIAIELEKNAPQIPLGRAIRDRGKFITYAASSPVREWIKLWEQKFLNEFKDKKGNIGKDPVGTSEVMNLEQAWERLTALKEASKKSEAEINGPEGSIEWLQNLAAGVTGEFKNIAQRYNPELNKRFPKARLDWEQTDKKNRLVEKYSKILSSALADGLIASQDLQNFMASGDILRVLIGIRSIGETVETLTKESPEKSKVMLDAYGHIMQELWAKDSIEIKDVLSSVWSRWASLGIIDNPYLEQFGAKIPNLDLRASGDSKFIIEKEILELAPVLESFKTDPKLSRFFQPVAILFGSRLKGYALAKADLDAAIFIKPDIKPEERREFQQFLSQTLLAKKAGGKIVEFWLEQKEGKLQIKDFPNPDSALADSAWAHVLFGGVWCGENKAIKELYEKLLSGYLFSKDKKIEGHDARKVWLEEIERDILQYRLMHKGYHRYFAEQGGIYTAHSGTIDAKSAFWDSGYRRLATKLFINRVFLPQLG